MKFNKDPDLTTIVAANIYLKQDGVKQLATVVYDSMKKAAILDPTSYLEVGKDYELIVENVKDTEGKALTKYTDSFKTAKNAVVTAARYAKGASTKGAQGNFAGFDMNLDGGNVDDADETFAIAFNTADMDYNTLNTSSVKLYDVTDSKYVALDKVEKGTDATKAFLFISLPANSLKAKHEYKLTIGQSVADLAGNTLAEDYVAQFFYNGDAPAYGTITAGDDTGAPYENVYPKLTPGSGKPAFRWQAQVTKDLNPETVNATNIQLTESVSGALVDTVVSYESGSRHIVIAPKADLKELIEYTVTIKNVRGSNGLRLPDKKEATAYTFTTGDYTFPTVTATTPKNADENVSIKAPIVVTFSEKMKETSMTLGTNIKLLDASDEDKAFTGFSSWLRTLSADGKTLTLTPTSGKELLPGRTYKFILEKEVLEDVSANSNKVMEKHTIAFTTENSATTAFKNLKHTGFAPTNKEIKDQDVDVESVQYLFATYGAPLKTNTAEYKLEELVKIERYEAETGNWTKIYADATAAADKFGVALDNSNKSIKLTAPTAWTNDADTAIDESTYNNKLVKDTKFKITLPAAIKDTNDNAVEPKTIEFTVGTKPAVVLADSVPTQYASGVKVNTPYVIVAMTDAESNLNLSTLNASNIQFVKKADSSAAPYSLAYMNHEKVAATIAVDDSGTADESTVNTIDIDGTDYEKVKVGNMIKVTGVTGAFVVTEVTPGSGKATIKVDRVFGANVGDNAAVTLVQGVAYQLNEDAKLDAKTEYEIKVSGVQDIAGNVVSDTAYTFETEEVVAKLKVVKVSVADGSTGIATGQKIEVEFNENIVNVTDDSSFVNIAGADASDGTKRVGFQEAGGTVVAGTYTVDENKLLFLPNGYLKPNTVYQVKLDKSIASEKGALGEDYEFSFKTEEESSAAIQSAKYFDSNGDGKVSAGDVIRLTFNTQSLTGTSIDASADFAVDGPGSILGAATVATAKNYADIKLAADSIITPDLTTIKVVSTGSATFTTGPVVIQK